LLTVHQHVLLLAIRIGEFLHVKLRDRVLKKNGVNEGTLLAIRPHGVSLERSFEDEFPSVKSLLEPNDRSLGSVEVALHL
jgi:hypothetical protein